MSKRKIAVKLTRCEWEIVHRALQREAQRTEILQSYESEIKATLAAVVAIVGEPCHWCGSLAGTAEGWDGNQRCIACQGC